MGEFFPLVSFFFDKHMEKIQEMGSSFTYSSPFPLPLASSDKIRTSALCHWPSGLNLTAKTSLKELAEHRLSLWGLKKKNIIYISPPVQKLQQLPACCLCLQHKIKSNLLHSLPKTSVIQTHPYLPTLLPTNSNHEPSTPNRFLFQD